MAQEPDPEDIPRPLRHSDRFPRSRKVIYKSFENLVTLANDQERWKIADVTKMGKQLVWRDVGEPPMLLEGLRECVEHAGIGGLRAGSLGFAARSGVNLFILLFQIVRVPKRFRASLVLRAIFSMDSLHFGAMLGTFVALYKFIVNALPILAYKVARAQKARQEVDSPIDSAGVPLGETGNTPNRSRSPVTPEGNTPDSYPNSDHEHGLSMDSLSGRKSALKRTAFTPMGQSSSASVESSRAPSPSPTTPGAEPSDPLTMPGRARRARFADDLVQTARARSREARAETAKHALRHPGHLSRSTQAAFSLWREKGYEYRRWHATVAGAIAGAVAILMERKSSRLSIAQQMFVRGLQGSFNHWSERLGITVPFGSVWVFALCCGQIMYGYLLRPDTIPPSYDAWIQKASIVPQDAVRINRELVFQGKVNVELQNRLANGWSRPWNGSGSIVTEENKKKLFIQIDDALEGIVGPPMASCAAIHPHHDSCIVTGIMRIYEAGQWMVPMYGALHFIPLLLFKWNVFKKAPLALSLKALLGTLRSASFLGVYVAIYQSYICLLHFLYLLPVRPDLAPAFRKFVTSKPVWWFGGILSGMSLFVEHRKRREELAMYVLPKGLESSWKLFRGEVLGVPPIRKGGWKSDVALCAAGMGMVMSTYQHSPQHLSGLVRRLLYQFVGPN